MARRNHSHWNEKHDRISALAGTMPAEELAKKLGVTVGSLYVYCSSKKISLRCKTKVATKAASKKTTRRSTTVDRGVVLADMVANLFDQNFSLNDPIGDAIKFMRKKLET